MCSLLALMALCSVLPSCGRDGERTAAPCDQECRDNTALRGFRETLKLAYNLTLQGNPVGEQDETTPCPLGGTARVFGSASSNAAQGATDVNLSYELESCGYFEIDEEPPENYSLFLSGTVTQVGVIAVQPSSTTALVISSDALSLLGAVYDPPEVYEERDCELQLGQDGDHVSGVLCGRIVGVDL
jgi:hypothetical protein